MKKVINAKRYDTETATALAADTGFLHSGLRHYRETLYRKKTGEFFLHGNGGALSRWSAREEDGTSCRGTDLMPLTLEQAREWVECHAKEQYELIFGELEHPMPKGMEMYQDYFAQNHRAQLAVFSVGSSPDVDPSDPGADAEEVRYQLLDLDNARVCRDDNDGEGYTLAALTRAYPDCP